jgi:Methenyl tetrahydrofolate cyclohydrolase
MYVDGPINHYLDDLSAKKVAPGGGSVAALTAALGTSLMSMVANFTIGKGEYKAIEGKVTVILSSVKKYDAQLRKLIDEDVAAYEKLVKGLKALKVKGDAAVGDELYKEAIEPPFLVCEISHNCLKLCRQLAEIGNKNLITDTAIAALMFESAYFSAKFNVYINLGYVKDTDYISKVHKVLTALEIEMPKLKEEVVELCEEVISNISSK